jgi:hypothetical protein
MSDLLLQLVASGMVLAGMLVSYGWLIRSLQLPGTLQSRGLVTLLLLTLIGSFLGGWFWWAGRCCSQTVDRAI